MTAAELPAIWLEQFLEVRDVPERGLCAVERFIFTCGLLTQIDVDGICYDFAARYCYPSEREARRALAEWDGKGDPPGDWIKEKVSGRPNPRGHG